MVFGFRKMGRPRTRAGDHLTRDEVGPTVGVALLPTPAGAQNIFSFVVHRAPKEWRCASAHNTDAVPRMETNVIDDGRLRSVNYRRRG